MGRLTAPANPLHRLVQPMVIAYIVEGQAHEDPPCEDAGGSGGQKVVPPAVKCHHP